MARTMGEVRPEIRKVLQELNGWLQSMSLDFEAVCMTDKFGGESIILERLDDNAVIGIAGIQMFQEEIDGALARHGARLKRPDFLERKIRERKNKG